MNQNISAKMITGSPPQTSNSLDAFLPYELKYIPEEIRKRAKKELFEDEETKANSLKLFRSMLKDEVNYHCQDDDLILLAYLRARKYDVKRALHLMKNFYHVKKKHEELYDNFNYDLVRRTLDENSVGFLPFRDAEGCVILVIRTEPWNPRVNKLGDIMRALTCGLLHGIRSQATQIAGFKVIVDFSGCGFTKLPYISPTYLWLFAEALQNCFPARFKSIHMVNEGYVIHYVWSVLGQFLNRKLRERFYFHGKNVKKLHKYFAPQILPAEYEGELPPFDNSEWRAKMNESAAFFTHIFSFGIKKGKKCKIEQH